MAETQAKVSIDDVEYIYDDLSDEAKAQIQSIQFADNEIARLNAQLAIANTAKIAYQNALKEVLAQ
ncbi:MAG: hypothetical protein KAG06_08090 [Methylococcales bacterium]|nr:hypothetical protein [Methylococcales bacterium]